MLSFWKADWFLGFIVVVVMLVVSGGDLIQSVGRKAYDLGVQAVSRPASDRIAVITVDDASIANIGRWPWSRDVPARMIDLAGANAKVIANERHSNIRALNAGLPACVAAVTNRVPAKDPGPRYQSGVKKAEGTLPWHTRHGAG